MLPLPAAVTVSSDVRSASVVALTPVPMRLCGVAYGRAFPFVLIRCDSTVQRVHSLRFSSLRPQSVYRLALGYGLHWWRRSAVPVAGILAEKSLPYAWVPDLVTGSIEDERDIKSTITILGTVISSDATPAGAAAILLSQAGLTKITNADGAGNFRLAVPSGWSGLDVELSVWAEDGWVVLPQPLEILDGVAQTIRLEPYAQ